jgi:hypothetical protein
MSRPCVRSAGVARFSRMVERGMGSKTNWSGGNMTDVQD